MEYIEKYQLDHFEDFNDENIDYQKLLKDLFIEIYSNDNIELEKLIDVNLKQYNFPIK